MGDLAGRGPLGQKTGKPAKKPRKPIPKQSARKRAHKATERALGGREHMAAVAAMPCLVCGCYGVEVHHFLHPRSDFRVAPLCPPHHRREFGEGAYHYSPSAFHVKHGTVEEILARVSAAIKNPDPKTGAS